MSDFDKSPAYDVYGKPIPWRPRRLTDDQLTNVRLDYYPTTRPDHEESFADVGAHPNYRAQYVSAHAPLSSGLPSAPHSRAPSGQDYGDAAYYGQPYDPPAYIATGLRQMPEVTVFSPQQGAPGTTVVVYFKSVYNLDAPLVNVSLMFGSNKCQSTLVKRSIENGPVYLYEVTAEAPPYDSTALPNPVPLQLVFDNSLIAWEAPSIDVGLFTYVEIPPSPYYPAIEPLQPKRKRKLSTGASPRQSSSKKPMWKQAIGPAPPQPYAPSPFRQPSLSEGYPHARRPSSQEAVYGLPSQQYYTPSSPWIYSRNMPAEARATTRSSRPSMLVPSPVGASVPSLVRTSALHSPPMPPAASFNPYSMYPNSKAQLNIVGDLGAMATDWTQAEIDTGRRLVQFSRSQSGSVITATFEAVTLENRIANNHCISCIWWETRRECYVTSVDTISLLEALVGVRFTVEEKNRIRRNLEGFRPATVSKMKSDSEDFFKLIMGFPHPKPRNIEKDVKVFPWRILVTALKKIIGKYASWSRKQWNLADGWQSASYSSTAGVLPAVISRPSDRQPDAVDQLQPPNQAVTSPVAKSTSPGNQADSDAYPTARATKEYHHSPGHMSSRTMLDASAGPIRMPTVVESWPSPPGTYSAEGPSLNRSSWDYHSYLGAAPFDFAHQQPRYPPSLTNTRVGMLPTTDGRFVPLQDYEPQCKSTTSAP
ncbi:hypothetical protein K470DRAFT_32952 [Piedraia hortae CBS 480.64]|uniref:DUF7082 domain-containing protein n=1 Tax=Piedraia hortae CBS 480.64 TaxID=1314780 RepID=A0A6A7C2B0_9PEZI|nr:hypothetical protein K470DRAFT_32952 [Piedraia hortae CBS 480.64]